MAISKRTGLGRDFREVSWLKLINTGVKKKEPAKNTRSKCPYIPAVYVASTKKAETATLQLPLFQKVLRADSLTSPGEAAEDREKTVSTLACSRWSPSMPEGTDANKCCQHLFQWGPGTGLIDSKASCHRNHTDFSIDSRSYYRICSNVVSIKNKAKFDTQKCVHLFDDTQQASSMLLAQIFTSMKWNVLPELIQEDRKKKKEKKWIPEALNRSYMTLVSGLTTESQTTSKEEAVVDSQWFLAYQNVFQLSWVFLFSQV